MGPPQGRAEGEENLPRPAGHTAPNASQDPICLLGTQGTLLAHGLRVSLCREGVSAPPSCEIQAQNAGGARGRAAGLGGLCPADQENSALPESGDAAVL